MSLAGVWGSFDLHNSSHGDNERLVTGKELNGKNLLPPIVICSVRWYSLIRDM
jgi:hypothetical protein